MSIPVSQFTPPRLPHWLRISLHLYLCSCPANRLSCPVFLGSTYMCSYTIFVFLFLIFWNFIHFQNNYWKVRWPPLKLPSVYPGFTRKHLCIRWNMLPSVAISDGVASSLFPFHGCTSNLFVIFCSLPSFPAPLSSFPIIPGNFFCILKSSKVLKIHLLGIFGVAVRNITRRDLGHPTQLSSQGLHRIKGEELYSSPSISTLRAHPSVNTPQWSLLRPSAV